MGMWKRSAWLVLAILLSLTGMAGYACLSTNGSAWLVRCVLETLLNSGELQTDLAAGHLLRGARWSGTVQQDSGRLPRGAAIHLGKVRLQGPFQGWPLVIFEEGLLVLPASRARVSVSGHWTPGRWKIILGTQQIAMKEVLDFLERQKFPEMDAGFLRSLRYFNEASLRFQELRLSMDVGNREGLRGSIFNAKVQTQDAGSLLIAGGFRNGVLDINLFSPWLSASRIIAFLGGEAPWRFLSGTVTDIDLDLRGPLTAFKVSGRLTLEKLFRDGAGLENVPVFVNLRTNISTDPRLYGAIRINGGSLAGADTARVRLLPGSLIFEGDPSVPVLDLSGAAKVGGTAIDIRLKGTLSEPELRLQSPDALSQDQLLLMLVTNRSWRKTEQSLTQKKLSLDAAGEFMDYFVFGGIGYRLSRSLGIKDVSLTVDKFHKGLGVTKELTGRLDARYEFRDAVDESGNMMSSRRIGGEYRLNDFFSLKADRETRQSVLTATQTEPVPPEDRVLIKYRRMF